MAVRTASDRCGDRFASGMPHPEMCLSGGDLLCLSGLLVDKKMKMRKENIEKTDS